MPSTKSQRQFNLISELGVAADDSNQVKLLQACCRNPNEMIVHNIKYLHYNCSIKMIARRDLCIIEKVLKPITGVQIYFLIVYSQE
jgi:hypothetical protein